MLASLCLLVEPKTEFLANSYELHLSYPTTRSRYEDVCAFSLGAEGNKGRSAYRLPERLASLSVDRVEKGQKLALIRKEVITLG